MILGVYWANKFPEGLYTYRYFEFSGAIGGHADKPADLFVMLRVSDADGLLQELKSYIDTHPNTFLWIRRHEQLLLIIYSTWNMFDYDFRFVLHVEQLLDKYKAEIRNEPLHKDSITINLQSPVVHPFSYPQMQLLQYAFADGGNKSSSIQLRFDCNIAQAEKEKFIAALDALATAADLEVFYYLEQATGDAVNLMLFFTNGRQINAPVSVDVLTFDKMIQDLQHVYNFKKGHIPGYDNYPKGPDVVVRMVDREFLFRS
jgi:hypothetical protein